MRAPKAPPLFCRAGHPMEGDNVSIDGNKRRCRKCRARTNKEWHLKFRPAKPKPTEEEKFYKYISKDPVSGCWLWLGHKNRRGYGTFYVSRLTFKGHLKAHRWVYERFVGPISDGLEIDHLCCVSSCVNPEHLEPVTHDENIRRGVERGSFSGNGQSFVRYQGSKTHCPSGHPYSGENLHIYIKSDGSAARICLACRRRHNKTRYEKDRPNPITVRQIWL